MYVLSSYYYGTVSAEYSMDMLVVWISGFIIEDYFIS